MLSTNNIIEYLNILLLVRMERRTFSLLFVARPHKRVPEKKEERRKNYGRIRGVGGLVSECD